ncbi:site-specific integrase [Bifidobacterium psychraerophilum]|uniref:tyrosine-type recombinase/integrase n=1 Tax=Bifidobacterium psychraerophilum TaxID=218140 RepID=UPI0031137008
MPKKRVTGAARPYTYTAKQSWTDQDGVRHTKSVQRWKIQLDLGRDEDGKRIRKTFTGKTSKEAKARYDDARGEIAEHGAIANHNATLRRYVTLFLEISQQRVAPSTWAHYRGQMKNYLEDTELASRIADIVPSDIQRILDRARKKGRSVSFRHQLWTCLDQVFELALADRVIRMNPVKSIKVKGAAEVETGRRAYSVPEMQAMLNATIPMPMSEGAIWWWRLFTGMRQSEILGAMTANLHLEDENPWYELTGSLAAIPRDHGCGDPDNGTYPCGQSKGGLCPEATWRIPDGYNMSQIKGRLCIITPKSKRSRAVPIAPQLAEVMKRYLKATKRWPNPHGLLFRNRDGSPRLWKQDTREFKALLEKAGMDPKERHGHETRYSAVTLMRKAGKDQKAIEEMIGHTSIKVDNIYTTIDAKMRADAVEAIPDALQLPDGTLPKGKEKTKAELKREKENKHKEQVKGLKGTEGRKKQKA